MRSAHQERAPATATGLPRRVFDGVTTERGSRCAASFQTASPRPGRLHPSASLWCVPPTLESPPRPGPTTARLDCFTLGSGEHRRRAPPGPVAVPSLAEATRPTCSAPRNLELGRWPMESASASTAPPREPCSRLRGGRRWLPITRCEARCAGASAWTLAAGRWPVAAHSFVGRDGTPSSFDQALTPALAVVPEGRLSGACMRSAWCLIVRSCLSSMNA